MPEKFDTADTVTRFKLKQHTLLQSLFVSPLPWQNAGD